MKWLFKIFIKKRKSRIGVVEVDNIVKAKKIFFAVFSRYGDGIISFKIIKEFSVLYPDKSYLLFTTNQLVPYAEEILGDNIVVVGVNKRNPISLMGSILKLNKFDADIGFNPWSHGDDAEFFISFAKKYSVFKKFKQWQKTDNLYARVREYLGLGAKAACKIASMLPKTASKIVFVPYSTDITKSLDDNDVRRTLEKLKDVYKGASIVVCGSKKELAAVSWTEKFYFAKTKRSSADFLALIKSSDLFVGVDAGPLHIVMALGIPSIGVFGPTAPQTIVDFDSDICVLRDKKLDGIFCFVKECKKPICIYNAVKLFSCVSAESDILEENLMCKVSLL